MYNANSNHDNKIIINIISNITNSIAPKIKQTKYIKQCLPGIDKKEDIRRNMKEKKKNKMVNNP